MGSKLNPVLCEAFFFRFPSTPIILNLYNRIAEKSYARHRSWRTPIDHDKKFEFGQLKYKIDHGNNGN